MDFDKVTSELSGNIKQSLTILGKSKSKNAGYLAMSGSGHYRSFWFRDIGYSLLSFVFADAESDACLVETYRPLAQSYVDSFMYLRNKRKDEYPLGPKCFSMDANPEWSVFMASLVRILSLGRSGTQSLPQTSSFASYDLDNASVVYRDQRGACAIDGPLLVAIVSGVYLGKPIPELLNLYIDELNQPRLVSQDPYSDWQDSLPRTMTFMTQLLLWWAFRVTHPTMATSHAKLAGLIREEFYDFEDHLFASRDVKAKPDVDEYGSDDMCMAILVPDFLNMTLQANEKAKCVVSFFAAVVRGNDLEQMETSRFTMKLGVPNTNVSSNEAHWHLKWAGIPGYHTKYAWSWIMAATGLAALKCVREEIELESNLARTWEFVLSLAKALYTTIEHDHMYVYEIYDSETYAPVRTCAYSSEPNFLWGTSFSISFFKAMQRAQSIIARIQLTAKDGTPIKNMQDYYPLISEQQIQIKREKIAKRDLQKLTQFASRLPPSPKKRRNALSPFETEGLMMV